MTELWQVSGRSDLSWDEAVRLDLRSVENWSFSLDCVILRHPFRGVPEFRAHPAARRPIRGGSPVVTGVLT